MFKYLKNVFLKRLYKLLIFRTIVLDKSSMSRYNNLRTFSELEVKTNKGAFTFIFKEDRRKTRLKKFNLLDIHSFLIELIVPTQIVSINKIIENHILVVVKVMIFKIDYKVLSEVLIDIYLDKIIEQYKSKELD